MIEFFKRISLLDADDNLSLTNLCFFVTLVIGCVFQSYPTSIMFLIAFCNYADKRSKIRDVKDDETKNMDVNMVSLQNQMDMIHATLDSFKKDQDAFLKMSDETRKLLSEKNLAKGFTGRGPRQ